MDKDEPLDQLFERSARPGRGVVPPADCLEPDTIAAWMDGTLPEVERAAAEMHAADCERCLDVLATVARTTPVPEIPPRPGWLSLRWLVPVATTAVAVTAWLLVRPDSDRDPLRREQTAQEITQRQPAAAPAQQPAAEPPARPSVAPERADATPAPIGRGASARLAEPPSATPVDPPTLARAPGSQGRGFAKSGSNSTAEEPLRDQVESRRAEGGARQSAAAAPSTTATDSIGPLRTPPPPAAEPAAGAGRGGPPPPPAPAMPPPASPASPSRESSGRGGAAGAGALAESVDTRPRAVARQFAAAPFVIRVPDSRVQWRVSGAVVQRSTDDGQSWQSQTIGTAAELLAGSATSDRICWIVGRAGTVLLTVDGERWQRLAFPDAAIDLIGVLARDADTATVTTATGRTYHTTDRGRTWILQGLTPAPF